MRKSFLTMLIIVTIGCIKPVTSHAQELGLSFSYFLPKNGYFSVPVSPISYREVGLNFSDFLSLETGLTLYLIPGMGIKDLPFTTEEPLMGPFLSVFVPLELVFQFNITNQVFRFKGGGFAFYNLFSRLNQGNFDRALIDYQQWDVATSNLDYENKLGTGVHFGFKYIYYLNQNLGITLGANYLIGSAALDLSGTYSGGTFSDGLTTVEAEFSEAQLDYSGLEFSLGVLFSGR